MLQSKGLTFPDETTEPQFSSQMLAITNASCADGGIYRCEASSEFGVDIMEFAIRVRDRHWGSNLLHNGLLYFGLTILVMFSLFLIVGGIIYCKFPQCLLHPA